MTSEDNNNDSRRKLRATRVIAATAGNCAYLRRKYGAKIAMHRGDIGMVERGDMSWNRKAKPDRISLLFRAVIFFTGLFIRPGAFDVFSPDVILEDGDNLETETERNVAFYRKYGFEVLTAEAVPGHGLML